MPRPTRGRTARHHHPAQQTRSVVAPTGAGATPATAPDRAPRMASSSACRRSSPTPRPRSSK
eukprot:14528572-Alexandrium_andersonii.AAC.1